MRSRMVGDAGSDITLDDFPLMNGGIADVANETVRFVTLAAEKIDALPDFELFQLEAGFFNSAEIPEDRLFLQVERAGFHPVFEQEVVSLERRVFSTMDLLADRIKKRFFDKRLDPFGFALIDPLVAAGPPKGQDAPEWLLK